MKSYQDCRDYLEGLCDCENNTQCKYHPEYYLRQSKDLITNPIHGGKVTCELCNGFIDGNFRYKKIGDRYQHMEEPCLTSLH